VVKSLLADDATPKAAGAENLPRIDQSLDNHAPECVPHMVAKWNENALDAVIPL
jgi:hypothetical protein